jgi:RNA polymerase sigma factor (sigma-70 family)
MATTTPAASDATLVSRLRSRDRAAWEDVYRLYSDRLFRFGYQLTGNPHDAADLVQETFVRALPRLDRLDPDGVNLAAYLLTTEKNLFLKSVERRKRQEPVDEVPEPSEPAAIEDDPERSTLLGRQQEEVRLANAKLAPRQRLVLALRELEDRSYAEIGELVGLNENAVAQLISRARQSLREELRLVQVDRSKLPKECQGFLPLLSAHLDGQLRGAASERTLAHLETCESCQAALADMREASRRYRSLAPLLATELFDRVGDALAATGYWQGPRGLRRFPRPRGRLAVVGAVAGLAIALGIAYLATREPRAATAKATRNTEGPALVMPSTTLVAEATGPAGARVRYAASARDKLDGAVVPRCSPSSGSVFPLGQTTVACTARDLSGNETEGRFDVEVVDTLAPSLGPLAPVTVEASGAAGAAAEYGVRGRDRVDGAVAASCSPAPGASLPIGTTAVTCKARDVAGNEAVGSLKVIVADTTPPALRLPDALRIEARGSTAALQYTVSAEDKVDGTLTPSCSPEPGASVSVGTTTVRCTARDVHGNTVAGSFVLTVLDLAAPKLVLPAAKTVEATGPPGARVTFPLSAVDRGDTTVKARCSPASGAIFRLGATAVRCQATDRDGNEASGAFTVRVVDTTPPALRLPSDRRVEAVGRSGSRVAYSATARDLVDGRVAVHCTHPSGSLFPLGTTVVRCTALDAHKNAARGSFEVTVADTTPSVLALPATLTVEATGPSGAAVSYPASASDRVGGALTPACSPASGATFPLGSTTVRCTARDASGNTAAGSFRVTVVDTTPPALSLPANKTVQATSSSGASVAYTASATDRVDGPVTPTCVPGSGTTFPIGTTTVMCTARDARGNTASGGFTVTVSPPPQPDLVVSATTKSFTISNVGNAAAGPFLVTVQGVGTFTFSGLAAGASLTRTVTCGTAPRLVVVDARNQVAESNEQNNTASVPGCSGPS